MNPTKREILKESAALQMKRDKVLHALAVMEMDSGLLALLRHAVAAYYAPLIELLGWEYQFIEEREAQNEHDAEAGNVV